MTGRGWPGMPGANLSEMGMVSESLFSGKSKPIFREFLIAFLLIKVKIGENRLIIS
jgi:hypothetical protein